MGGTFSISHSPSMIKIYKLGGTLLKDNNNYAIGCCNDQDKCIYINDTLSDQLLKKVLCHEITHAAMFSYDVYLNIEQEELLADLIATYGQEIIKITNQLFKKIKGTYYI